MKEYIRPMIIDNDSLAESVYASGSGEHINCWTITHEVKQRNTDMYDPFVNIRIKGEHFATHTTVALEMKVLFDKPIRSAVFDFSGFDCSVSGNTVVLKRNNHANGYGSLDKFDSNLRIVTDNPDTINVVSIDWNCIQG